MKPRVCYNLILDRYFKLILTASDPFVPYLMISLFKDRKTLFITILIAVGCSLIYGQSLGFDFVNLDDDIYVYENPQVTGGFTAKGFAWAMTAFHASNWHPLTWISHQIDASFFGAASAGPHAVNVILHIVNSILLFVLLKRITAHLWPSAMVAAIFAFHPAHVESVAWIAERKDVLSTLFWLLTTWTYVSYTRDRSTRSYALSIIFFILGLMAKPMLVTLPFTLLLLDVWPLKRIAELSAKDLRPAVKEKLPYFMLAVASSVLTIMAQTAGGAVQSTEVIPIGLRLLNAVSAIAKYVGEFFVPVNLGVWYPFRNEPDLINTAIGALIIFVFSFVAIKYRRERGSLFTGWFWFLGTLVPVIGIVQVGRQAMADRYTYVPYIGLSIAIVWAAAELFERIKVDRRVVAVMASALLAAFGVLAFIQTGYWKDSEKLYLRALSVTERNYLVSNNLCDHYVKKNRAAEAVPLCENAIAFDPTLPQAYNTLGTAEMRLGKFEPARKNFEKAASIQPDNVLAMINLSGASAKAGDLDAAGVWASKAVAADKEGFFTAKRLSDVYFELGAAALGQKRPDKAEGFFSKAANADPTNVDARRNEANAIYMNGRADEAIAKLNEIITKFPRSAESYNTLGIILAERGQKDAAAGMFQKALDINPNFTQARANLQRAGQ